MFAETLFFFSLECVDKSNTKQWPLIICRLTQIDREDKETYFGKENEIVPSVVCCLLGFEYACLKFARKEMHER